MKLKLKPAHSRTAFFLAKVLACFHFTTIVLLLSRPIIPWGIAFLTNITYSCCTYGHASIISMLAKRGNTRLLPTNSSLVLGILCGGAPTLVQVMAWGLKWLWRMGPRY